MANKNIISIKKNSIIALFTSLLISFITVFCFNHFGVFEYIPDTSNVPSQDEQGRAYLTVFVPSTNGVLSVAYNSYFGSKITIHRPGYIISDVRYRNTGKFYQYDNVIKYYINGTLKDYVYIMGIWLSLFAIYLFFSKFKINFT